MLAKPAVAGATRFTASMESNPNKYQIKIGLVQTHNDGNSTADCMQNTLNTMSLSQRESCVIVLDKIVWHCFGQNSGALFQTKQYGIALDKILWHCLRLNGVALSQTKQCGIVLNKIVWHCFRQNALFLGTNNHIFKYHPFPKLVEY